MQRYLVTGGAGFIGSSFTEFLLKQGAEVHILDNLSTGSLANLTHALTHPNCSFHQGDILDKGVLLSLCEGMDAVFHLAALADVTASYQATDAYFKVNVEGTLNVVEAVRARNVKRLTYAASASCYGLSPPCPINETLPLLPASPYALTKQLGEELVLGWGRCFGFAALSLRLFNVYGPRVLTKENVFSIFLSQKKKNLPLTICGDGTQTRDFVHVTDVARAFYLAAQSPLTNEVFNVGSGQATSILHLVKLMKGEATFLPARPGDPEASEADISKIHQALGWQPQISLEQGLAQL